MSTMFWVLALDTHRRSSRLRVVEYLNRARRTKDFAESATRKTANIRCSRASVKLAKLAKSTDAPDPRISQCLLAGRHVRKVVTSGYTIELSGRKSSILEV